MIRSFFFIYFSLISFASAGVALHLEHPRYPSKQKDIYNIKCEKTCFVAINSNNPAEGTASPELEAKIKELMNTDMPRSEEDLRKVMYKIEATDGTKKLDFVIGYPYSYKGKEFSKYNKVISLLEDIKREMRKTK